MKKTNDLFKWLIILTGVSVLGCTEVDLSVEETATNRSEFDEFLNRIYQEPDTGIYIVNGDTPIETLAQLEDFYVEFVRDGALIVHQTGGVDASWDDIRKRNLTYCVSTTFGNNYNLIVNAMAIASGDWQNVGHVKFAHLAQHDGNCAASNTNVLFDVRPVNGQPYLARAFFPNYSRANRNILIDSSSFGNIAPYTLAGVLRHELGHALGFRHEHTRPEAAQCFENSDWRPLTAYDSKSAMHYPQCNGTNSGDLLLTELDKQGIGALYGKPLAWGSYASTIGDWNGDGQDDIGLVAPASGVTSYFFQSSGASMADLGFAPKTWGGYEPVTGDWNGDGKTDVALFATSSGGTSFFYHSNGSAMVNTGFNPTTWGGYEPVTGDWNGDGKTDVALFATSSGGTSFFYHSNGSTMVNTGFNPLSP
jgi:hypothetical protein